MAALRPVLFVCVLAWSGSALAEPLDRWTPLVAEASRRFAVPEAWIRRVMRAESGGRTTLGGRPIVSRAGAMGLMQLMPGTWHEMRFRIGLGPDPHQPRDNILAGTAYLRLMYDRFGYPGLFAAYNAGPARYAQHLASRRRLPAETLAYVATVTGGRTIDARIIGRDGDRRVPAQSLFAVRQAGASDRARAGEAAPGSSALFVQLTAAVSR